MDRYRATGNGTRPSPVAALDADATEARLHSETDDVRAAIALVARGTASRVAVSGLAFGEQLLALLSDEAGAVGVELVPSWWPDDAGCDITAQRIDG